ncbi:murein biosynthesis integral membrane protein MurJ [Candidatus Gottesmanbacteria bacterium]|nr:murein biosynthesis integral membrane protein MurJ [Candidatus Gottesmanbacteria bacterium]
MVKLFKHTFRFFSKSQTSIISAATVIMVAVLLSRVLGLVRDWLLATHFTPSQLGVYIAAFRIPNMIFELLVMGALSSAFIPVFTAHLDTKGKEAAFRMASSIITIGTLLFFIFSLPMVIFAKEISHILAPGFTEGEIVQMASFTQIMIVAQVFPLIIGNFFTGILQSFRNFLLPSIAPIVYNVGIILGIVFLSPYVGLYGPVLGVVLGAFLFAVIQIPIVFAHGYRYRFVFDTKDPGTREVGKLMFPRTVGLAVSQIDTTIDLVLSTLLGAASVTAFNFAQHLQQLPIGLFGASIAQATFPSLSSLHAKKDIETFKKIFLSSFHQILFLVVPLSAILIVLRFPVVRLVYGIRSLFDITTTFETSRTLAYFSISLFAQAIIHLLARSFYALHDSKTPLLVGAVSVLMNTALSIIFIKVYRWEVWALGLSASIASIVNMVFLLFLLDRKIGAFNRYELLMPTLKIFLSGIVTGVALYIPIKLFDQLVFDTTRTINLFLLTGISTVMGLSVYFFLAWFLEVPQVTILTRIAANIRHKRQDVLIDTSEEIVNDL